MSRDTCKGLLVFFLFVLVSASLACGGGGSSSTTTSDSVYSRSPGMSTYLSVLEGDYGRNLAGNTGGATGDIDGAAPPMSYESDTTESTPLEVFEPDLYTIDDDTLFVVNSYRGLYVMDISDPTDIGVRSNLRFRGSPRYMYTNGNFLYILLDDYLEGVEGSLPNRKSALLKINVSNQDVPTLVDTLTFDDSISDSRMVGDAIYLVTATNYFYGPMLTADREPTESFDGVRLIAVNTNTMTIANQVQISGYISAIQGGQNRMVVAVGNYSTGKTRLHFYDVSSTVGNFAAIGTLDVDGWVADRFKLNFENSYCYAISHSWDFSGVSYFHSIAWSGNTPVLAARLTLAKGEQQFASRFGDEVCYLVTFEQIDPLWVINLANPLSPVVSAELILPGWSIYLETDGDRLISVGYDGPQTRRVKATLFDVSNKSLPNPISTVLLGDEYGWTPVDSDDKTFSFMKNDGLLVVPVHGYGNGGRFGYGMYSQICLVDYNGNTLTKRGKIETGYEFKRSFIHRNALFGFTATRLFAYDISDRDDPAILDDLILARNVVAVEPVTGGFWRACTDEFSTTFEVVDGTDPNAEAAASLEFEGNEYYALFKGGTYAYLLTREYDEDFNLYIKLNVINTTTRPPAVVGTLTIESQTSMPWYFDAPMGMSYYPAWGDVIQVSSDLLAFKSSQYKGITPMMDGNDFSPSEPDNNLMLIDISNPANPVISARVGLPYGSGEPYVSNGHIYLSYFKSQGYDKWSNSLCKYYVIVIDPTNRANPSISDPVNTPGRIVGVKNDILFCIEGIYSNSANFARLLNSARLSEGSAVLLDSLEIPDTLWRVVLGDNGALAGGITRPNNYYFNYYYDDNVQVNRMDALPGGHTENYNPASTLYIYDISNPADMTKILSTEFTSSWAEISQIISPYIFIQNEWQIMSVFELSGTSLNLVDYNFCGYYSDSVKLLGDYAYMPAGYFGVIQFDLD